MSDDESRAWTFQMNIAGLTLLLFASSYLGRHLAILIPLSGIAKLLTHYLGELVLTAVAVGVALWRAYRSSDPDRGRAGWLDRVPVWLYVGLGAVGLNLVLMTVLLIQGRLE